MSAPTLLQIKSSIFGDNGQSNLLANAFVGQWQQHNPEGRVRVRDLNADPLPHFDADYVAALSTPLAQRNAEQQLRVALADQLIDELQSAQTLVIGLPMYNFGVPTQLKAWIDYVARAGTTFRYTANGPQGLLEDRPTYLFATRGGQYQGTAADSQTPYMRTVLNFLGIRELHYLYAEGLAGGEQTQQLARNAALLAATEVLVTAAQSSPAAAMA